MSLIGLVRHGPTQWNAQGLIQGSIDAPLSEEGLEKMRRLKAPPPFDRARVYASPMLRARQTAEAMGLAAPVLDARLVEQNWGRWEGLSLAEIRAKDGADAFTRAGLKLAFRPPGGESVAEVHERVQAFLADASRQPGDALVIAHLGVLRAAYSLATGWNMETPMPEGLDVNRLLVLELKAAGAVTLHAKNVDLISRTA
jgi:probable phosphoglycerate mutase